MGQAWLTARRLNPVRSGPPEPPCSSERARAFSTLLSCPERVLDTSNSERAGPTAPAWRLLRQEQSGAAFGNRSNCPWLPLDFAHSCDDASKGRERKVGSQLSAVDSRRQWESREIGAGTAAWDTPCGWTT